MLVKMRNSIDLSNKALNQVCDDFKEIMKRTKDAVTAIQNIVTLKSELKAFNEQINYYQQAFIELKTVIKDLEDILDLPDFYKRFLTEMKRRSVFDKKWEQKTNDAVAYFHKLCNDEQELRIRFEILNDSFLDANFSLFFKNSFRSSCPSVWLNQSSFVIGNNVDVPSINLTITPIPPSPIQDNQNEDELNQLQKEGKKKEPTQKKKCFSLYLLQNLLN